MRLTIKALQSMQMASMQAAAVRATSRKRTTRAGMASSLSLVLLAMGILGFAGAASAQVVHVYLEAQQSSIVLDGVTDPVPTWVFVCDPDEATNPNCEESSPGAPQPTIRANAGEDLVIHLNNELRTGTPLSVMIPGQAAQANDTDLSNSLQTDGQGRPRVRSFTKQTGFTGTRNYRWNAVKPGTYLYQSATQPSLQVPMGLFGALIVDGYGTTPAPVDDVTLLFSEIDPVQNQRVADASGAATPECVTLHDFQQNATIGYPCTIDYHPTHVLVNGDAAATETTATAGDVVQLRLLNAGLRTHNPAFVGLEMELIAEDGNLYPGLPRVQSHALLPAGKTLDALVTIPSDDMRFSLFDRMPTLSADGVTGGSVGGGGGTLLSLTVGTPPPPTSASTAALVYAVDEDTPLTIDPPGQNALTLVSLPMNGSLVELTPGLSGFLEYEYTPNQDFSGADGFAFYRAGNQTTYIVTLNVGFENDAPVAVDDAFVNALGGSITVPAPGVLANDIDVDGDTLTAVLDVGPGVTLNPDGSFEYTGGNTTFTYHVEDEGQPTPETSDVATVTLTVNPSSGIALTVEDPDGTPVTAYRWLVQEDAGFQNDPGAPPTSLLDSQSLNFHKSYMPVVAQGCVGACETAQGDVAGEFLLSQAALDPSKHYYVSVLPNDAGTGTGHTIGGAQIPPLADRDPNAVTVIVNDQEVPTAQVSVLVFEDNAPTNGVPEPDEPRLGGFQVILEDAGGRYGISGGTMSQDAFGAPLTNALPCAPPSTPGVILTCPDGNALIQNLPPGKYGVIVVPPIGEEGSWTQTSTIEGSKVIDAWVKANEPPYFLEFGGFGPHAFVGFVNPANTTVPDDPDLGTNRSTITGRITTFHDPRPNPLVIPGTIDSDSYLSLSHTRPWIGLNSGAGGGPNWATVQADVDDAGNATFEIPGVPDGSYELAIWDDYLDQIIASRIVDVAGGSVDAGNIPVFHWFSRTEHNVFLDDGCGGTIPGGVEDGIRQDCEAPLSEQALNLRWRDGTVNQSFPTDLEGFVPFDQTFPFFSWQVLEVDYTRFKATGMTVTVDAGGIDTNGDGIDDGDPAGLYSGLLNSQEQGPCTQDDVDNETNGCTNVEDPYTNPYQRTETGQILTQGVQIFPGQTSIFDWGKAPYAPGENGGISGIVFYGSTRGENDPRLTVGDPWEPGIPGVKVRLYREVERDPALGGGTALTLVQEVTTDSWDDSIPSGCPGEDATSGFATVTLENDVERCYDGWRNWNQARPAVFDGGYAFNDIPAGKYIVEVEPPPGYELIKEEDVNVGFGDAFGATVGSGFAPVPVVLPNGMLVIVAPDQAMVGAAMAEPGIAQPPCVGEYHTVPAELSLFPGMEAPFALSDRPLCDRKEVILSDQGQAAADFHLFTTTPVAAQFTGLITDDISNEFNPLSPGAGEKWSPAYLPFAIRDFGGREVYRGYSDAFGRYNGVLPSTFTANIPIPSGYSPAMMLACLNDAGDGTEPDPYRLNNYGNACYTAQFMPGTTTYLDTPILPSAAFAGGFSPVDCAPPQDTPVIRSVNGNSGGAVGPWINAAQTTKRLTILSEGFGNEVPNPRYEGPTASPPFATVVVAWRGRLLPRRRRARCTSRRTGKVSGMW